MGAYIDQELLYRTLEIAFRNNIDHIIETGTSDGYSTQLMARCFNKVQTIEVVEDTYNLAKGHLQNYPNVIQYLGNSADVLNDILVDGDDNCMFFLDAHWEDYCPLKDEFKAIKNKNIKPPIIIHDFYVPNFFDGGKTARFGYDSYNGNTFTIEWLWEDIVELYGKGKFHYYYNVSPTSENSGILFLEPIKS
jgi:hypothetical protein